MSKRTVLVVEDDAHLLSGIREILELENYSVRTATNGLEGLDILNHAPESPPDIIVSDIMMPYMSGFEFLEAVRKEDRWVTIPFIFLTAKGEKRDKQKGHKLGVDIYLTKPFDAEDLIIAVNSRLKRHEDMAKAQDTKLGKIKRQILTILNHEFRTPLTLVVAYADMLRDVDTQNMSEDELVMFLKGVNSGADRLRRLVENFILLVELESGDAAKTYGWRKKPIDNLEAVLQDIRRQMFSSDGERPFNVSVEGEFQVVADREFLSAAVRELVHNAYKFSPEGSAITLGARKKDEWIEIWVQDEGRGIPPDQYERIWDTFYQFNREVYEDQGAGAGLAIVRGVVDMHNGQYELSSELGKGSTFTIRIPVSATQ